MKDLLLYILFVGGPRFALYFTECVRVLVEDVMIGSAFVTPHMGSDNGLS